MNLQTIGLVAMFCILAVFSVVLSKHVFMTSGFEATPAFFVRLILNPLFVISMGSAFGCRIIFYALLKTLSMSQTFLITQVSAVFVLLAGWYFFKDVLSMKQMFGAGMILVGVGLVA